MPLTLTLSPAFAEAASRRQAQGERGPFLFPLPSWEGMQGRV